MDIKKTGGIWQMLVAMFLSGTIGWFVLFSGQSAQDVVFYRCVFGGIALMGLSFTYPLVAIIIDVTLLGVNLTVMQIIGMGLILLAAMANQLGWKFNKKYSYIFEPDKKTKPTWVSWR